MNPSWEIVLSLGAPALLAALAFGMLHARRGTPEQRLARARRSRELDEPLA